MNLRTLFWALLFLCVSLHTAQARMAEDTTPDAFTYASIRFSPGYSYTSLLNQDGSKAVFSGPVLAGEFDLMFTIEELGLGVGPLVHYSYADQNNLRNANSYSQELYRNEILYGLKGAINPFYVGFGYGTTNVRVGLYDNGTVISKNLESKVLGFTGGVRLFGVGENWHIGMSAWYKNVFFNKVENTMLQENTSMETVEFMISISYSPLFQIL